MAVRPIALFAGSLIIASVTISADADVERRSVVDKSLADGKELARKHLESAYRLEKEKRFNEAIIEYTKALKADPRSYAGYFGRSAIYASEKKDYGKAVADLSMLLKFSPLDYAARFNRALYIGYLKKYDKAIADYTAIIEDEDTDFSRMHGSRAEHLASTYHYRGRTYQWRKKEYAKAAADYTMALKLQPKLRMVHYRRGQVYHELGNYKQSAADFAEAHKRDPDYHNLLVSWAWQLATCPIKQYRDGGKAVKFAEQVTRKGRTRSPILLDLLAAAYAEAGQYAQAVKTAERAVGLVDARSDDLKKAIAGRLKLYRAGKPFRQKRKSAK